MWPSSAFCRERQCAVGLGRFWRAQREAEAGVELLSRNLRQDPLSMSRLVAGRGCWDGEAKVYQLLDPLCGGDWNSRQYLAGVIGRPAGCAEQLHETSSQNRRPGGKTGSERRSRRASARLLLGSSASLRESSK